MSSDRTGPLRATVDRLADLDGLPVAIDWAPGGSSVAVALGEGSLCIVDAHTGGTSVLEGHEQGMTSVAWNPRDPDLLATGGLDGMVRTWSPTHSAPVHEAALSDIHWVQRVAWRPDGLTLAAISGTALVVLGNGEQLNRFDDHGSTLTDVGWHPRGRAIAVSHYGGITTWSPRHQDGAPRRFEWKGSSLRLAWSPDGRYVVTGDQDSTVHFWIMKNGKDLQMWGYPRKVQELSWDSVGRHLATGGGPEVIIWDCSGAGPAETEPVMLEVDDTPLAALAFAPVGRLIAAATDGGTLSMWHMADASGSAVSADLGGAATAMAWSPDGSRVAVGDATGGLTVATVAR
ncbi:MAG: WD40 repeat domain-containing protein [Actinomycetota bacterium]|nr:WD40 repeat domain-containing protein [Actinomycetota bacterium]